MRRDTLVTITTTREFSFTLSEYRRYFGPNRDKHMDRRSMEKRLREDNGQFACLLGDMFAPENTQGGYITKQTYVLESYTEEESAT
jgi:hypothetical protein